jgi:hypothetical protein
MPPFFWLMFCDTKENRMKNFGYAKLSKLLKNFLVDESFNILVLFEV